MLMPGKPCPGNNTCCNRSEFDRAMYPCSLVDTLRARIAGLERQLGMVVVREREEFSSDWNGLAAMIDKVRERGWRVHYIGEQQGGGWGVWLDGPVCRDSGITPVVNAFGTTLPKAFARAALLTTLETP